MCTVPLKIVLYTEKNIIEKVSDITTNDFKIAYIADSYQECLDRIIEIQADIVIFQLSSPIYQAQDFFVDLLKENLSPILLAFTLVSYTEIIYSITTHEDTTLITKLKNYFKDALQDNYNCYFNSIGKVTDKNAIMNARVNKLEKTEYLNDILRGGTEEEFIYYKKKASLNLQNSGYYLYLCNLMDIEYVDHDLNKNIYYLVGELLIDECQKVLDAYNGGEVFYINPTLLCIIINDIPSKSQATYQRTLMKLTNKLNRVTQTKTARRYRSSYIKSVNDIRAAYESLYYLKAYNFFCHETELLTIEYIKMVKKDVDFNHIDSHLQEVKERFNRNIADPQLIKLIQRLFLDIIKPSLNYDLYYYCYTFLSAILDKFQVIQFEKMSNIDNSSRELFTTSIEQKCEEFIEQIKSLKNDISHRHLMKSPIVLQAIDFIHGHYSDTITITIIAEKLNVSHSYLSQVFTKEMGISPQKYLITHRIQKSKELMMTSNMNIYSIASEVGYFDPKQFSKTFKKVTGITPTQYKKNNFKVIR
ncbi:AraC family transcriptional regulator [Sporosarcina sp. ACRSM]|uniref:AraC family transcriptional regulator n=1 Tax=Sporosarcina sp. ACRSM TaxID=2918216 RepID=UPI001EF75044|nr:AraC family transcriptional regulator [Sporosarcina sp. ACRSM]MCG7336295.1 AraC family transcriptional regulator [Sporosarcina sp. ACRSM]